MVLNKCCCCYDLRRGAVVFLWIQMIFSALGIAAFIAHYENLSYAILWAPHMPSEETRLKLYGQINYAAKLSITYEVIKAITCIPLTFGLIKKNHMFYQPWLLIFGFDNVICSIASIALIIVAFYIPLAIIGWIVSVCILAIRWYFWICIRVLYKRDIDTSVLQYKEEETDDINLRNII